MIKLTNLKNRERERERERERGGGEDWLELVLLSIMFSSRIDCQNNKTKISILP